LVSLGVSTEERTRKGLKVGSLAARGRCVKSAAIDEFNKYPMKKK
jgi:hypothetical protein